MIKENHGRNETKTPFNRTERGGISSAGGLGAIEGFKYALVTAYKIYYPASIIPGNIAAANNLKGDSWAITE